MVTRKEIEDYQKHFSADTTLVIRFGTTETGTLRRMFFNVDSSIEGVTVPVGYAIEDADISLLDEAGKEAGFNGVGEIVVKAATFRRDTGGGPILPKKSFFPIPTIGASDFTTPAT